MSKILSYGAWVDICGQTTLRENTQVWDILESWKHDAYKLLEDENKLNARIADLEAELACLRSEREWIPVSERLPLPAQKADGYMSDSSELVHVFPRPEKDRAVCYLHYLGKWSCSAEVKVTHWMPLPPPPTAENKESSTDDDLDRWAAEVEYCKRRAAEYEKEKKDG